MIKLPVQLNSEDEFAFTERDGFLFSTIHLNEEEAEELIKRINMHDELVEALVYLCEKPYFNAESSKIKVFESLLERCK